MSNIATRWARRQRGLKPAAKVVLWCLADHHNGQTGECFPMQETIAEECEISRSTVNLHLDALEKRGLIRRVNAIDDRTKRQRPTRYILNIDAEPVSETHTRSVSENRTYAASGNETRAVSEKHPEPCPKNEESRVRNSDSNLGREPGSEPGRVVAVARATRPEPSLFHRVLGAVGINEASIWPRYWIEPGAELLVNRWSTDLGLTPDEIVAVAQAERSRHQDPPDGPKALTRAMRRFAGEKAAAPLSPISAPAEAAQNVTRLPRRGSSYAERFDAAFDDLTARLAHQPFVPGD